MGKHAADCIAVCRLVRGRDRNSENNGPGQTKARTHSTKDESEYREGNQESGRSACRRLDRVPVLVVVTGAEHSRRGIRLAVEVLVLPVLLLLEVGVDVGRELILDGSVLVARDLVELGLESAGVGLAANTKWERRGEI